MMCKSFVKLAVLFFLILCIFEVNATQNKTEPVSDVKVVGKSNNKTNVPNSNENDIVDDFSEKVEDVTKDYSIKDEERNVGEEGDSHIDNIIVPKKAVTESKKTEKSTTTATTTVAVKTVSASTQAEPTGYIEYQNETDVVKDSDNVNPTTNITSQKNNNLESVDNIDSSSNSSNQNGKSEEGIAKMFNKFGSLIVAVGAVSVGLVAVSGYKVLKRKSGSKSIKSPDYYSSPTPPSLMIASEYNNKRVSLVNSLISEGEREGTLLYYSAKNRINEAGMVNKQPPVITIDTNENNEIPCIPYRMSLQSETSANSDKSVTVISVNRNSIISRGSVVRHSFLNPNLNIIRTGKRTQQLYEATSEHPAIIETFPSLERPFVPSVPVPLEESDTNSLHPHSIYQMYQEEMEYENYYAYTIDDKEYIIDPTTNQVLEIHDLNTDEYMLVEEELYLDFSGSSDDSDSDKQTI
ncbi:hypothetical protein PIROE2DRAFT_65241 [Piromyces sp. E2]|nr:hypothetical protein PIROE2DRAFT_65241 [Piromyces sp. E2]|eukprot:OUM57018.1 hypothetical protein PIROE2DRAFT_65241 [Piromyces sp. E2]